MSAEARRQLLRRLQKVVKDWPEDPSRKGRDFGEFLRNTYMQRFKEDVKNDVRGSVSAVPSPNFFMFPCLNTQLSRAEIAVKSLERLSSNHHRKMFSREKDYSFSEGLVLKHPLALSNSMGYTA